LNIA
ncbi:hypothetical protein SOVF_184290, partial [Spinacia oleracea]